jgi:hypothetical protein
MRKGHDGTMSICEYSPKPSRRVSSEENAQTDINGSWDCTDWQRVWFRTQSRDWRTLALVPGDDQISTFEVANSIARVALDHGQSIHVADVRELRPKNVDAFLDGVGWDANPNNRVIFATRSVSTHFAAALLARAADCAILCVSLGSTSLCSVREAIEEIGREHFLGSLLVRATAASDPPKHPPSGWWLGPKPRP